MAVQQVTISAAPAAKPAGGNGGSGHKPHRDDRKDGHDNRRPWNQPSSSNDFPNFQVHSAAAQSQGNQQQPQRSSNTDSNSNANNNFSNRSTKEFKCPIHGCESSDTCQEIL